MRRQRPLHLPHARPQRRIRLVASILMLLTIAVCSCGRRPPSAAPSTPAGAGVSAASVARQFVALWQSGRYSAMYALLSSTSQQSISATNFVARYHAIDAEATITATRVDLVAPAGSGASSFPFSVTYTTSLFGAIRQQNRLPLVREGSWRVRWSPALMFKQLAGTDLIHLNEDWPKRGSILDRQGRPLATNGTAPTVGTSKSLMQSPQSVPDPAAAIAALAQALGIPAATITAKLDDPNTPPDAFIPLKTLPYDTAAAQRAALQQIPGVLFEDTTQRIYPTGSVGAQTIGYVAPITASELATLRDQGYDENSVVGQTGLEATFESTLAGKVSAELDVITADGRIVTTLARRTGAPAQDVVTTLDADAEQAAAKALGPHTGSVTVIDPRDNGIRALVSYPSFDPNAFAGSISAAQLQQLQNNPNQPFLNRPVLAAYPPGSTFKVITTAAGIDHGGYTPQTTFPCTPVWYGLGPNYPKKNWTTTDNEPLTIAEGLMRSCDPVFYAIGLHLYQTNQQVLTDEAAGFGVGKPTDVNGVVEAAGIDPGPAWKQQTHHQPWYPGDEVNMSIGQGYVTMTPLQITNMFSAIADNGVLRSPLLVEETRPAGTAGPATIRYKAKTIGQLPASPTALAVIHDGMRLVTQDPRGTAYSVFFGSGLDAAGKSGTAEDANKQTHALFAAYAPRTAPQAVVLAVLDHGELGSAQAGPITRDVLTAIVKP